MLIYDLTTIQPHGNTIKVHGAGKYSEIVFKRLVERDIEFCSFYNSQKYISEEIIKIAEEKCISLFDVAKSNLEDIVLKYKNPVIFSLIPNNRYTICKTVGTIHDVRELYTPNDFFQFRYKWSFQSLKIFLLKTLAPNLIKKHRLGQLLLLWNNPNFYPATITNFTKYTIYNICNDNKMLNMPVFYTPTDMGVTNENVVDDKFILMVSGNRWIKNCLRGIIALDNIFTKGHLGDYHVVVTGVSDKSIFKYRFKNPEKFVFKSYVDEIELNKLFSHCSCLLFPSLYEGFGMPPIEAMKYGKPVIISCQSSMPEVCDDGAIYVNPLSIDDIASKILMLLCNKEIYAEYQKRSVKRYGIVAQRQMSDVDNYINYVLKLVCS